MMASDQDEREDAPGIRRRNLNFLYTLDAILNSSSLAEAARIVNLSQPAISITLQKAREQFNDAIVISRSKRRFTDLADQLRPRVRKLIAEANDLLDHNETFDPKVDRRTIRISMPDFIEATILPRIVRSMRFDAPNMMLTSIPFDDSMSVEDNLEQNMDFVILPAHKMNKEFSCEILYYDTLTVMQSRKPGRHRVSLEDYMEGSHIALLKRDELLADKNGPIANILSRRNVVARIGNYATVAEMVCETDLIATLSSRYAQDCAGKMPVAVCSFPADLEPVDIGVQWQPYRDRHPMTKWFVELLKTSTRSLGKSGRSVSHL